MTTRWDAPDRRVRHAWTEILGEADVEVLVHGQWQQAEVKMRVTQSNANLTYHVRWHLDGETYLDVVPIEYVRQRQVLASP